MIFRTVLPTQKSSWNISHEDFILSMGSCFADCISEKLSESQFNVLGNPFGIIYNPLTIISNLISSSEIIPDESLFVENGNWRHYNFHSEINGSTSKELKEKIEVINEAVSKSITNADYLILTLGTAFVYFLQDENIPVGNCHKMPSGLFSKRMLSTDEIIHSFESFLQYMQTNNPKLKIILTVSPVRHIKDSLELNTVSKAILRLVSWQLSNKYPDKISYFPSYEIMMDDLRDYRFYKDDMIHPTTFAEKYIWDRFSETFFTKNTIELNREISELIKAIDHRPFQSESSEYRIFLLNNLKKAKKLNDKVSVKSLIEKLALKLEI